MALALNLCIVFLVSLAIHADGKTTVKRGHLEPLGNSGSTHPIEEISQALTAEDFVKQYASIQRPVVLQDGIKTSPAVHLWSQDEYLKSQIPEGDQETFQMRKGKKESRKIVNHNISFKEFLSTYKSSDIYADTKVPQFLAKDIVIPGFLQCKAYNRSLNNSQMWMADGPAKSLLHVLEESESVTCVVRGNRDVTLVNMTKYVDNFTHNLHYKVVGAVSKVDVEQVDLDSHPYFERLEFHKVTLKAGDCIYIPSSWLHYMESTQNSMSVNFVWETELYSNMDSDVCQKEFDPKITLSEIYATTRLNQSVIDKEVATIIKEQIASIVMGGVKFVTLSEYLEKMKAYGPVTDEMTTLLTKIFEIIDTDKDGKITEEEIEDEADENTSKTLVQLGRTFDEGAAKTGYFVQLSVKAEGEDMEDDGEEIEYSSSQVNVKQGKDEL